MYVDTHTPRQSAWFFGNCLAATLGGLISYGIGHITSTAVSRWQLIFLILGAITSGYAFLLLLFLPDSPGQNHLPEAKRARNCRQANARE